MNIERGTNRRRFCGWVALAFCLALPVAVVVYLRAGSTALTRATRSGISQPNEAGEPCEAGVAAEPNLERLAIDERRIAEAACAMIEQGRFDEAGRLMEESGEVQKVGEIIPQLSRIVEQWQRIQKERQKQREVAYKEQLAECERLKTGISADDNDVGLHWRNAPLEDIRVFAQRWLDDEDVQQNYGVTGVLAAVTRTIEFADDKQKKELLSDPCVLKAIDKAKTECAELEAKGRWLDGYVMYYSWLAAMEPNNKGYADYAEGLIDKAEIAASFQDNPCETGRQRVEGVKRRIFERAADALNFNYINKVNYRQMATKGIRRCRLLAEVVRTLTNTERELNSSLLGESFKDFRPDANAITSLCSALGVLEQETADWPEGAGKDTFLAAFEKALELNLASARLPEEVVIAQFAEASFLTLDPYTVIVWPRQVQDFEKMMTNEFSGIGIEIIKEKGQLTVASLLPDTPAYNSGLDAGDVIERVDEMPTKDMPLLCAVRHITGPSGTKVALTIKREDQQQPRQITITRAKIVVPTIRGWQRNGEGKWLYMVDERERIGYVRLTSFAEKTARDLEETLNSLEASGVRGLILDLRFNSGGFFDSAVEVADAFLDEGLIVITRPRFGIPIYTAARGKPTHPNYPLVVLINAGSASASEIVAGALADPSHRRATLIGERTYGKGVVQGITHYPGGGAQLKYTMAYYHLPSGQRVKSRDEAEKEGTKDWGIAPDITAEIRSDEFRKMNDIQRDNDVLVKAGHDDAVSPLKKHTLEQTVEVDPQLATAILVIKSKLIREQARAAVRKAA
jgi:carboxyl-terminal processing protease